MAPASKVFHIVASSVIFILLFIYFFHPITNLVGDLGYYLKTGEIIVHTGSVPKTNLFSYTYPEYPFINPNWLSEVVLYLCFSVFGFTGLTILSILIILTAFFLIYFFSLKKFDVFTTILVALLSIHILYERTDIKPELFSFLLLSAFITILYTFRGKYTRLLFALIPLELLWVNLHIYFFVGIVLIFIFLFDEFITYKRTHQIQKLQTLTLISAGVIVITVLNPNTIKGVLYPFFVLHNYAFPVEENISFFTAWSYYTHDPTLVFFLLYSTVLWSCLLFAYKKVTIVDSLICLFFTILGFSVVRTFPLFVFATFIPFVKTASSLMEDLYKKIAHNRLLFQSTLFIICIAFLFPTIISFTRLHGVGFGVIDNAQEGVAFIKANNLHGPIYNNYDIGNYLDFKLYPKEKVFADARPEAYPKDFFQNIYFPMQRSIKTFNNYANTYAFTLIFIKHTDPSEETAHLISSLASSNDWKMVFLNNTVVLFLKNAPEYTSFIANHEITSNTVQVKKTDKENKESVRQFLNFFRTVGWDRQWLEMNHQYLLFEPHNCSAMQNIAYILQKHKDPHAKDSIEKYIQQCT